MRHIPIKLGPLALLLAVISICMTTLGILTFTTARADLVMAEKYAATVRNRYELEYQGQSFLRTVGDMLAEGTNAGDISGTETDETGAIWKTIVQDDSKLVIGILPDPETGYKVVSWRLLREWSADESMGDLWDGE